jgi:hypothetical protein
LKKERPAVPDRVALRALYDQAVDEINATRDSPLTTTFYLKIKDAVFEACYAALVDHHTNTKRMHTVAAPPGAGKTTFSLAFIVALTRYSAEWPEASYGAVFLTDRDERADEIYRELDALLPGDVAIWTGSHDHLFKREALRQRPVAVVNNQFYFDVNGKHARGVNNRGHYQDRALTIIDERPQKVDTCEILLSEAEKVREALLETHPETKEPLDKLFQLMEGYSYKPTNKIYLPQDVSDRLAWFTTATADRLSKLKISGIDQLFGFAKATAQTCGFVVSDGALVRFVGYSPKGPISAGTVLMDATADVDGVAQIVPYQVAVEVPQARYDRLEIICVPQHTSKPLNKYFKTAKNQKAYVRSMVQTIEEHTVGERGLVVCKKTLFDQQRVPNWPEDDPRFDDPKGYTEGYGWTVGDHKLCAVHWGTGVGSNAWRDAETLFLFDEFHLPKRVAVAHVQGLRGHTVHQGDLPTMKTINSTASAVEIYRLGHRLRWIKQMALRGRARCYDENGVCGQMRLVISCELETFMSNVSRLFPGAKVRIIGAGAGGTWSERVIGVLNATEGPVITTSEIGKALGKPWRSVMPAVRSAEFESACEAMGWRYVPGKGRAGGRFEWQLADTQRVVSSEALAA